MIVSTPVLIYPEPSKPYILYTDSSKDTWAGILTQTHTYTDLVLPFNQDHILHLKKDGSLYKRKHMLFMQASRKWFST